MKKDSRIYIAGHTGLVGSAIVRKLKHDGYARVLLRTRRELDLFDTPAVQAFFKRHRPEYVVLAAARVGGIKANMTYSADFLHENLLIQNNVIWSALHSGVKKFLFLGSSCVYPRECPQPMKESHLLDGKVEPTNEGYAIAKIAGLKLCEKIYEQYKRMFISCMPTNIYGPNDNFDPEASHVVPALIRRFHEAKVSGAPEVVIWGTGKSRREFMHVDDLADAVVWMLKSYEDKQFLNLGTGRDITIRQLTGLVKKIVGYPGKLVFDATKPDGMPKKRLDVTRMLKLGFRPRIPLDRGLRETYQFFLDHIV